MNKKTFPRLEKMLHLIRFLHNTPGAGLWEIKATYGISEATFYRFLHAVKVLGMKIDFVDTGYYITSYGIIEEGKL